MAKAALVLDVFLLLGAKRIPGYSWSFNTGNVSHFLHVHGISYKNEENNIGDGNEWGNQNLGGTHSTSWSLFNLGRAQEQLAAPGHQGFFPRLYSHKLCCHQLETPPW